jgi:hypothetical protein
MALAAERTVTGSIPAAAPAPTAAPAAQSRPHQTPLGDTPPEYPASAPSGSAVASRGVASPARRKVERMSRRPRRRSGFRRDPARRCRCHRVVEFAKRDDPTSTGPSVAASGTTDFKGAFRADYGPGTDLDDNPVANAPATTANWEVRLECGAAGCVATTASANGNSLLSNMTFDLLGAS